MTQHKYHATPQAVTGRGGAQYTFDSKKEAARYRQLALLERAGRISGLRLQVPFELLPSQARDDGKKERAVKYIADFVYTEDGKTVVEDVKGYRRGTAYNLFAIKRKLMLSKYGITIRET